MPENSGKLGYRVIPVIGTLFRYRVRQLETDFLFSNGTIKTFANWDIKGVRERHYRDEYVNVPVEEYLRASVTTGDIVEYGIKAADVTRFIEGRKEFFEDLMFDIANDGSLDAND